MQRGRLLYTTRTLWLPWDSLYRHCHRRSCSAIRLFSSSSSQQPSCCCLVAPDSGT